MYLRLAPNLLYFLPDLTALYALRRVPNFFEIHPWILKRQPSMLSPNFKCISILLWNKIFLFLFQVARVSSNAQYVGSWLINVEEVEIVPLINIIGINANIADSKNAWKVEWDLKVRLKFVLFLINAWLPNQTKNNE
jgi:hypothetical protein